MQGHQLLHTLLRNSLPNVHSKRLKTLIGATHSLQHGKRLTLTGLGRSFDSPAKERYCIQRMDRFLGNEKLHREIPGFYKFLSERTISINLNPIILIDWSCVSKRKDWHILRASLALKGRPMTLYQEVHPSGCENSPAIEKKFLETLSKILPPLCKPIIVTDAGFRCPWFLAVKELRWDFLGRVRNKTCYQTTQMKDWGYTYDLYDDATSKPKLIENILLSKENKLDCHFVLYRKVKRGRKHINRSGKYTNNNASNRCARREREPWLLATSLTGKSAAAIKKIVLYYQKRMQIEEDFRDSKSHQFGFALRYSRTNQSKRLEVLLLIAAMTTFMCWLMAISAQRKGIQRDFQANSIKHRVVLSVVYLACQLVRRNVTFTKEELEQSLEQLQQLMGSDNLC